MFEAAVFKVAKRPSDKQDEALFRKSRNDLVNRICRRKQSIVYSSRGLIILFKKKLTDFVLEDNGGYQ